MLSHRKNNGLTDAGAPFCYFVAYPHYSFSIPLAQQHALVSFRFRAPCPSFALHSLPKTRRVRAPPTHLCHTLFAHARHDPLHTIIHTPTRCGLRAPLMGKPCHAHCHALRSAVHSHIAPSYLQTLVETFSVLGTPFDNRTREKKERKFARANRQPLCASRKAERAGARAHAIIPLARSAD